MVVYDRSEFGWPVVVVCAIIIGVSAWIEWSVGMVLGGLIGLAVLAMLALTFSTLRVRVIGDPAGRVARIPAGVTPSGASAASEVEPAPPRDARDFLTGSRVDKRAMSGGLHHEARGGAARLEWSFWLGFPRGSVALDDVTDVDSTTTTLLDGIGIHLTGRGWVWNVHNGQAVWVHRANRGPVIIGTSDPHGLCAAIEQARSGRV